MPTSTKVSDRVFDTSMFGGYDNIDYHGILPWPERGKLIYVNFRVGDRLVVRLCIRGTTAVVRGGAEPNDLLDVVGFQAAYTRCMAFITANQLQ